MLHVNIHLQNLSLQEQCNPTDLKHLFQTYAFVMEIETNSFWWCHYALILHSAVKCLFHKYFHLLQKLTATGFQSIWLSYIDCSVKKQIISIIERHTVASSNYIVVSLLFTTSLSQVEVIVLNHFMWTNHFHGVIQNYD